MQIHYTSIDALIIRSHGKSSGLTVAWLLLHKLGNF